MFVIIISRSLKMKNKIILLMSGVLLCSCSFSPDSNSKIDESSLSSKEFVPFEGSVSEAYERVSMLNPASNFEVNIYVGGEFAQRVACDGSGKTLITIPRKDEKIQALFAEKIDIGSYMIIDDIEEKIYEWGMPLSGRPIREENGYRYSTYNLVKGEVDYEYKGDYLAFGDIVGAIIKSVGDEGSLRIGNSNSFKVVSEDYSSFDITITIEDNEVSETLLMLGETEIKYVYSSIGEVKPITLDDYNKYEPKPFVVKENLTTGEVSLDK